MNIQIFPLFHTTSDVQTKWVLLVEVTKEETSFIVRLFNSMFVLHPNKTFQPQP